MALEYLANGDLAPEVIRKFGLVVDAVDAAIPALDPEADGNLPVIDDAGTLADSGLAATDLVLDDDARLTDARTPTAHHATHENGGTDEISVAGLSGVLADPQTPAAHAASHLPGGSDVLQLAVDKLLGRATAGTGDIEAITCTAAGRAILDDASASAQRTTLGLAIGTDVQAYHANLAALAGLALVADRLPYADGAGTLDLTVLTALARTLIGKATADEMLATLFGTYSINQSYGATSTINGFSSLTAQNIFVTRVGPICTVNFALDGTSNSGDLNFTLPYTAAAGADAAGSIWELWNNGSFEAGGVCRVSKSTNVLHVRRASSSNFAASGRKIAGGSVTYVVA